MITPIRPEPWASAPKFARRRSVTMTTHIGESVQQVKFWIPLEGTHANSANLKKEVVEAFPRGDERFLHGVLVFRKCDHGTVQVRSNLSLPHGLY